MEESIQRESFEINFDKAANFVKNHPNLFNRIRVASQGLSSSYGPTKLHLESLNMARLMNEDIKPLINELIDKKIKPLENKIKAIGGPVLIYK